MVDTHGVRPGGPRRRRGRTPPRRRRRDRDRQHALALRPHLRQRRVPRGVRRRWRSTPTRPPATRWSAGARTSSSATATTRDDPWAATRCGDRDRAARHAPSPPRSPSTSATGWSSWSTPAAATPRATWCVRVPDADVLLAGDLVEESAPPSFGDDSWPMDWPLSLDIVLGLTTSAVGGRAGPRRPGRPGLRRGAAQHHRHRRRDDPRPRRPAASPSTRRWPPAEWPYPREQLGGRRTPRLRAAAPQPEAAAARLSDPPGVEPGAGVGTA